LNVLSIPLLPRSEALLHPLLIVILGYREVIHSLTQKQDHPVGIIVFAKNPRLVEILENRKK